MSAQDKRITYLSLTRQLAAVQGQIDALHALPYSCRADYWWDEEYARLQQSRDAIRRALDEAFQWGKPVGSQKMLRDQAKRQRQRERWDRQGGYNSGDYRWVS